MLYGLLEGALMFRYDVKGHFFALATLAFAEIIRLIIINSGELNSASGYYKPLPSEYGLEFGFLAFQFRERLPYYFIILGFLIIVTSVSLLIKRSAIGLYLFAIRENEASAASLGISPYRYKMFAMGVSAFFTAWGGAFWAMYFTTITPDTVLNLFRNVEILLPALLGGISTVIGPIVGALIVTPLSEIARQTIGDFPSLDRAIFGVLLVFIILFNPQGMIRWPEKLRRLFNRFNGKE
jgi:branched-chain amino acid transport system permease protein